MVKNRGKIQNNILFILLFTSYAIINAQEKFKQPSVSQLIGDIKLWRQYSQISNRYSENAPKCATSITFEILRQFQHLNEMEKMELSILMQPPVRHKYRGSGFFTVHYDTIGYNTPSLLTQQYKRMLGDTNFVKTHKDSIEIIESYVDSVLYYFNYSISRIVDLYGYLPPPIEPGYEKYNIYISELGSGLYGQTVPITNPINPGQSPPRYYTYIEIDNDFISVFSPSRGMPGLKVTTAHELHHAIQLGSYGYRENDRYFYEITSTWMEDLIYDEINDYYQYIKTSIGSPRGHFATPEVSFIATDGLIEYSRAIFGKYIEKKFSPHVIRNAWDIFKNPIPYKVASFYALNQALIQENSNLRIAFVEFAEWNYYTKERTKQNLYYKEAYNYPLIKTKTNIEILESGRNILDSLQNFSTIYQPIKYKDASSTIIINNINYDECLLANIKYFPFNLQLNTTLGSADKPILPGVFARLKVNDIENWSFKGIDLVRYGEIFAYPNPFIIGEGGKIKIAIPEQLLSASLFIYNNDMSLIYQHSYQVTPDTEYIEWDARDENGVYVTTGIYFFVLNTEKQNYLGKIAIIRQ